MRNSSSPASVLYNPPAAESALCRLRRYRIVLRLLPFVQGVNMKLAAAAALAALAAAGAATAAIAVHTVTIQPGHCRTIHATKVCAARTPVITTVYTPVTVSMPVTVTVPNPDVLQSLEGSNIHDIMHNVFPNLATWWNSQAGGASGTASVYQNGGYWSYSFTCFGCGN